MDSSSVLEALKFVLFVVVTTALLNAFVPIKPTLGYVQDNFGDLLAYKLNGLRVYVLELALCALLVSQGVLDATFIAKNLYSCLFAANIVGLTATAGFLIKGYSTPVEDRETLKRVQPTGKQKGHTHAPISRLISMAPSAMQATTEKEKTAQQPSFLYNFYTGMEFNPRIGLFDFKMFLYLVGAILLQLTIFSAVALHMEERGGEISNAMLVYVLLFTWFIVEYIYFENIHIYTYDIFAEKLGFKLCWGCLFFYPFFYPIGIWSLVPAPANGDLSSAVCVLVVILFFAGWILTRGANYQKFLFKTRPTQSFFGIAPVTIPDSHILCSGFWGMSRHINFLGEILQAVALALPGVIASGSLLPLAYPLYYVALFVPRQAEDDKICLAKYGAAWEAYMKRVPYRIIPFVF